MAEHRVAEVFEEGGGACLFRRGGRPCLYFFIIIFILGDGTWLIFGLNWIGVGYKGFFFGFLLCC